MGCLTSVKPVAKFSTTLTTGSQIFFCIFFLKSGPAKKNIRGILFMKPLITFRVLLNPGVDNSIPEIYAKVLSPQTAAPEPGSHEMRLQFTWIPDAAVKYLQKIRSNQ